MNIDELIHYTKNLDVLYVEDDLDILKTTKEMFGEFFNNLIIAYNGEEGYKKYIEYYEQNNKFFDIVITDINMPKIDGIEMSKKILNKNNNQQILVISAHNESKRLQELINIGISDYIHKPLFLEEFLLVIEKIALYLDNEKNKTKQFKKIQKEKTELEILNDKLNNILQNSGQGFLTIDKDLIIGDFYSKECLRIFEVDDIYGENITNLLFKNDKNKNAFYHIINKIIQTKDFKQKKELILTLPDELRINGKDIRVEYRILEEDKFMLILTDISEIKRAKKELGIFKDNMIAIFTHELKTPLNAIINFAEFLEEDLEDLNLSDLKMLATKIKQNGKKQLSLVQNLLEVAKIKSKNIKITKEEVQIAPFLKEKIKNLDAFNKITIFDIDEDLVLKINKKLFGMVFDNLYSNALKYSKSKIKISAKKVDGKYQIEIEDDGEGIKDSEKEKIFLMFEQASKEVRDSANKGTGIGLYTAKVLAKACNRDILVEDSNLGGAKFIIKAES